MSPNLLIFVFYDSFCSYSHSSVRSVGQSEESAFPAPTSTIPVPKSSVKVVRHNEP